VGRVRERLTVSPYLLGTCPRPKISVRGLFVAGRWERAEPNSEQDPFAQEGEYMELYATELMGSKAYDSREISSAGSASSLSNRLRRRIACRITYCHAELSGAGGQAQSDCVGIRREGEPQRG